MKRSHFLLLLALALVLGTASFFMHQSDYPLTSDEGDYLVAVRNGFWANWTDNDDIPISTFVQKGLDAVRGRAVRSELSDFIRSQNSTMFHRHQHPPLAFYPAIALQPFTTGLPLQWQLRLANLFWLLLWAAVLAWLGWRWPEARTLFFVLLPASAAWAMAVVGYNMHIPFGLLAALFLLCWYLYDKHGATALKRAAQLLLAGAFATVEYGIFLLGLLALWGAIAFWKSGDKKRFFRDALASAGWVLLFFVLLWPAGLLALGLAKSWVFQAYIALFRLSAEPVVFHGWWELLLDKWNANPVELLLLFVLLAATLWRWRALLRHGSLFVASGFILALLYLQLNPALVYRWYLFPAFAVAFVFLGHVVMVERGKGKGERGEEKERRTAGVVPLGFSATAIVLFLAAWALVPEPDYSELKDIHRLLRETRPKAVVIPRSLLPPLRPYLPETDITSHHDVAFPDMALGDSITQWRQRALVITPVGVDADTLAADGTIGNYRYFLPR